MAIESVQFTRPETTQSLQGDGALPAALAALKPGDTVDAVALARLETGETRLALLGTLLDVLPNEPLQIGESVKLTVVDNEAQLAVAIQRQAQSASAQAASAQAANPLPVEPATLPSVAAELPVSVLQEIADLPEPALPPSTQVQTGTAAAQAATQPQPAAASSAAGAPAPAGTTQAPVATTATQATTPASAPPADEAAVPANVLVAGSQGAGATGPAQLQARLAEAFQATAAIQAGGPGVVVPRPPAIPSSMPVQPALPVSPAGLEIESGLLSGGGQQGAQAQAFPVQASQAEAVPDTVQAQAAARTAGLAAAGEAGPAIAPQQSLTPEAREALGGMVEKAVANQQGRGPLIANAVAILAGAGGKGLPDGVKSTLAALVSTAVDPMQLTPATLKDAVTRSGSFQEASLLKLAQDAAAGAGAARASATPQAEALQGDAKSVLLALRSVLQGLAGDAKAAPVQLGAAAAEQARPALSGQPAPPQHGAVPEAQAAVNASLAPNASAHEAARTLLTGAEGALDRVRLLQAASLPDDRPRADATSRNDRLVEVPLALPNGQTPVMSLAVGRDGQGSAATGDSPTWRMRLSLDLAETGPMHADVAVRGGHAGVTLWAQRQETADLFRSSIGELRDALTIVDLDVGTLDVRAGEPPHAPPVRAGSFLDRRS